MFRPMSVKCRRKTNAVCRVGCGNLAIGTEGRRDWVVSPTGRHLHRASSRNRWGPPLPFQSQRIVKRSLRPILTLVFVSAVSIAGPEHAMEREVGEERIRELIRGLDSGSFDVREKAELELMRIGADAYGHVHEDTRGGPPELRVRASCVAAAILCQCRRRPLRHQR